MKKIAFILPTFGISGGIYVALKTANLLATHGRYQVTILLPNRREIANKKWIAWPERVRILSYAEAGPEAYDMVFATWWETLFEAVRFKARTYAFFMQALEGSFYRWGAPEQRVYEFLIKSHRFPTIASARWLLNHASQPAYYFVCGMDRSVFYPTSPVIPHSPQKTRFLIEGPVCDPRKNVARAIQLLEHISVEYVAVGPDLSEDDLGPNCLRLFKAVPIQQMAAIYSSADVLIKLSNAEGMFGPPLEMFCCGGTALCWDVPGAEEYMVHGYNSLLAPMNHFSTVVEYIHKLVKDRELVETLKSNAKKTAGSWPSWTEIREKVLTCFDQVAQIENQTTFPDFIRETTTKFRSTYNYVPK